MAGKGPEAFRTISEVAESLDLPQHVLRFWETRFTHIKPMKRGGGRRYYRPEDVELLRGIRTLLYGEGYTIRGVQRILREQGPRYVVQISRRAAAARRRPVGEERSETRIEPDLNGLPVFATAEDMNETVLPVLSLDDQEDDAAEPGVMDAGSQPDDTATLVAVADEEIDEEDVEETPDDSEDEDVSDEDEGPGDDEDEESEDDTDDDAEDDDGESIEDDEDELGDGDDEDDDEEDEDGSGIGDEDDAALPAFDPRTFRPPVPRRAPSAGLSSDDRRRLEKTLAQLLAMKRKLDQARG